MSVPSSVKSKGEAVAQRRRVSSEVGRAVEHRKVITGPAATRELQIILRLICIHDAFESTCSSPISLPHFGLGRSTPYKGNMKGVVIACHLEGKNGTSSASRRAPFHEPHLDASADRELEFFVT